MPESRLEMTFYIASLDLSPMADVLFLLISEAVVFCARELLTCLSFLKNDCVSESLMLSWSDWSFKFGSDWKLSRGGAWLRYPTRLRAGGIAND